MTDYRFDRECRTPYSEAYSIVKEEQQLGRVDLHYTSGAVYATLCVSEDLTLENIQDLIELVDEELVMSAEVYREDFIVTVPMRMMIQRQGQKGLINPFCLCRHGRHLRCRLK